MEENKRELPAEETHKPMSWLQILGEVTRTLEASIGDPLPGEFWQHLRASRKERLLAVRTLIDTQIERLEHQDEQAQERKATRITVE